MCWMAAVVSSVLIVGALAVYPTLEMRSRGAVHGMDP